LPASPALLDLRAPRTAPFGLIGWIFMIAIFGGTTWWLYPWTLYNWSELGTTTVLILWLVAAIPTLILYALWRMFARFALRIYKDGVIEYVQPFKTTRIAKDRLATVNLSSTYVGAANRRVSWIVLGDHEGKKLEAISPMAFGDDTARFFETLRVSHPKVKITGV
jgi:hypothetical protein